ALPAIIRWAVAGWLPTHAATDQAAAELLATPLRLNRHRQAPQAKLSIAVLVQWPNQNAAQGFLQANLPRQDHQLPPQTHCVGLKPLLGAKVMLWCFPSLSSCQNKRLYPLTVCLPQPLRVFYTLPLTFLYYLAFPELGCYRQEGQVWHAFLRFSQLPYCYAQAAPMHNSH